MTQPSSESSGVAPPPIVFHEQETKQRSALEMETKGKAFGAINKERDALVHELTKVDIRPIKDASVLFGDKTWKKVLCAIGSLVLFPFIVRRAYVLHKAEALYEKAIKEPDSTRQKEFLESAEKTLKGSWTTRELSQYPLADRIKVLLREDYGKAGKGNTDTARDELEKFDQLVPGADSNYKKIHQINDFFIGIDPSQAFEWRYNALQDVKKIATTSSRPISDPRLNSKLIEQCNIAEEQVIQLLTAKYHSGEATREDKRILLDQNPTPLSTQDVLRLTDLGRDREHSDIPLINLVLFKAKEAAKTPLDHSLVLGAINMAYGGRKPPEVQKLFEDTLKAWSEFSPSQRDYVECVQSFQTFLTPEQRADAIHQMKRLASSNNTEAQEWLGDYYRDVYNAKEGVIYVPVPGEASPWRQAIGYYEKLRADPFGDDIVRDESALKSAKLHAAKCKELSEGFPGDIDPETGHTRLAHLATAIASYDRVLSEHQGTLILPEVEEARATREALVKEREICMRGLLPPPELGLEV